MNLKGCSIGYFPSFGEEDAEVGTQPLVRRLKRALAKLRYDQIDKAPLKYSGLSDRQCARSTDKVNTSSEPKANSSVVCLKAGDLVRVRSREEIEATLDTRKEFKGCAFLQDMWQYCGTVQRVLQPMERFLDERDYRVKKCKGIVLLEGIICRGAAVFGQCNRCCHLFWKEEWLEKIDGQAA